MQRTNSILYMIQVQPEQNKDQPNQSIPPELQDILNQFDSVFESPTELPPARPGDHQIPLLEGTQPFCLRPYRYNPTQKTEIESQIKDMLSKGWIQSSTSPFSSPILLMRKKTGDWRLCVDYRRLNA